MFQKKINNHSVYNFLLAHESVSRGMYTYIYFLMIKYLVTDDTTMMSSLACRIIIIFTYKVPVYCVSNARETHEKRIIGLMVNMRREEYYGGSNTVPSCVGLPTQHYRSRGHKKIVYCYLVLKFY